MTNDIVAQLRSSDFCSCEIIYRAADRIEQLEDAIFRYVSTVVRHEGVTFIDEETEDWQRLILSLFDARAALEGK